MDYPDSEMMTPKQMKFTFLLLGIAPADLVFHLNISSLTFNFHGLKVVKQAAPSKHG